MALTKVINDLADLNQSGSTNALKGCAGTTAQQPASSSSIEYLIVGGGGAGGWSGGGGGAGGLLTGTTTVYHGTPTVLTIGEGGNGIVAGTSVYLLGNGNDSIFDGIRAIGGGTGGSWLSGTDTPGFDGASGGGAGTNGVASIGGSGTTGQGSDGGDNFIASAGWGAGGGGGAGTTVGNTDGVGLDGTSSAGGNGGSGRDMQSFINNTNANLAQIGDVSGSNVWFAGGGGGGIQDQSPVSVTGGTGGNGGGANGSGNADTPTAAQSNTGGGGGGGGQIKISGTWYEGAGGDAGSGVGVVKYDNTIVTGYTLNSGDTATINWPAGAFGKAYWPLNLNTKDIGGNYDGTSTDITYAPGKFSNAASFNGSSSAIVLPNNILSSDFSISVWFYLNSTSGNQYLFEFDYECRVILRISSTDSNWAYIGNSGYFNPGITYNTGQWYHLVITFSNGNPFKIYVDNTLSYTGGNTSVSAFSNDNIIGAANSSGSGAINGMIEQLRIYDSVLTASNITDIYNNSKPGTLQVAKTASDVTTSTCSFPSGVTGTVLYQFEGNADDSCTVGPYDGTEGSNISYVSGKFGTAANFPGNLSTPGDGIVLPSSLSTVLSNDYSISIWFNADTFSTGCISGCGNYPTLIAGFDSLQMYFCVYAPSSSYVLRYYSYGASTGLDGTIPLSTGTWYHTVLTQSSTNGAKIYVNGVLDVSNSGMTANATTAGTGQNLLGGYNSGGGFDLPWEGMMDQIRVYSSVLTAQQVYDLWQKENNIQTHFTSGSTDTLVFKSGSGEISFTNDTAPGAEVGMLRYNTTLQKMEHFNSGGWKDFTNV